MLIQNIYNTSNSSIRKFCVIQEWQNPAVDAIEAGWVCIINNKTEVK